MLVDEFWLAICRVMRNGAMTCTSGRIGKKMPKMGLPAAHGPTNSTKTTEERAQDSISEVTMTLYNPLTLIGMSTAFLMFLWSMKSRVMIMSVRRRLSAKEIE